MSFANWSLATRFMALFVGASMLLVVVSGSVLYLALARGLQWRDDQVLEKRMLTVRDLLSVKTLDPGVIDHEVSEDLEGPRQLFMRVIAPAHIGVHETPLTPSYLTPQRFPSVSDAAAGGIRRATIVDNHGREFRVLSARVRVPSPSGGGWATIQIAADTSLDADVLNWYTGVIVIVVTVLLVMCVAIGWAIVRTQMRPLQHFADAAGRIESSKLDYRLTLSGLPTELRDLGEQFNQMLERLETAYNTLRYYADDIAHELRTPLSRIQLGAEVALRQARTVDDFRSALESNQEDCEQLSRLVTSLLFLARAETGQAALNLERIDVAERLEKIRAFFEASASSGGITLSVKCPHGLAANADPGLFQRAVSNIVANSIAHTPPGGSVTLSAWAQDRGVAIEIADTGEGIPEAQQPFVFDRYFRGSHSRTTDQERVGIGLAITKCIVELHKGTISLRSGPTQGTAFRLTLPGA